MWVCETSATKLEVWRKRVGGALTELLWFLHSSSDRNSPVPTPESDQSVFPRGPKVLSSHTSNTVLERLMFVFVFLNLRKDNLAVCMTQKHQLKTIPCIIYYLLGWNLSACINSLYKLRLGGFLDGLTVCVGLMW